ncbi:MAG: hypothetical protein AAB677_00810 [Patescibacteria group bacterium]
MALNHHAYLFIGPRHAALEQIEKIITAHGPAEVHRHEQEIWNIEDSRQVSERQQLKTWTDQRKFFVIAVETMTIPAQQALLKVLEEPAPQTHFMIVCRESNDLLPTLRSRCQLCQVTTRAVDENALDIKWAKNFFATQPDQRLSLIAELTLTEEGKIDRRQARRRAEALELICHDYLLTKPTPELAEALKAISQARNYLADQSSLPKLIFEHLALVLPIL